MDGSEPVANASSVKLRRWEKMKAWAKTNEGHVAGTQFWGESMWGENVSHEYVCRCGGALLSKVSKWAQPTPTGALVNWHPTWAPSPPHSLLPKLSCPDSATESAFASDKRDPVDRIRTDPDSGQIRSEGALRGVRFGRFGERSKKPRKGPKTLYVDRADFGDWKSHQLAADPWVGAQS